jgi:hypothetical protein
MNLAPALEELDILVLVHDWITRTHADCHTSNEDETPR